jgi:hypothetical protein
MYMNVDEVESALVSLAGAHPSICELIQLPHQTVEGRTSHAVRIGTRPAHLVDAYYLTGGVHAREWGSCEILVNLAVDLCGAYAGNQGLGYGGKNFSPAEIKALVEQTNLLIFPCVNPDGRNFSQKTTPLWRKNRNPASSGGDPLRIGVDINRNQDFLWDFQTAFAPSAVNAFLASADPAVDTFHGVGPASELETKNINHIHDSYPRIRWYVDVHSYSEDILYVWGDDETQVTNTAQNFTNAAYDGSRGLPGDAYSEYIPDADLGTHQRLGAAFTRSLSEVRGKLYVAKPGFSLYATAGTNDDYAYSRHVVNPSDARPASFTVEWGTEFQPPWTEMEEIIKDVCAGLIGLGLEGLGIDSFIVTDRDTFSADDVGSTTSFPQAFSVVVDGFSPNALGAPGTTPTIQFRDAIGGAAIASITAGAPTVELEDPSQPNVPQRIRYVYEVDFADASAFTQETRTIYAESQIVGITDVAPMTLLRQPNPYMVDGPISWLSTDLRVFQLRPNDRVNASSAIALGDPSADPNAPTQYIQSLLGELRAAGNAPAPAFEHISQDEQTSQLELSRTVQGHRICNFAVAKVRYRANTEDATDVRVFFRTFNTMVSDLSYTQNPTADVQNYRRTTDGKTPLLGTNQFFSGAGNQIVSIPYFSAPRVDTAAQSMTSQPDPLNTTTVHHAPGQESIAYFGCWLDFNQTEPRFPVNVSTDGPYANRVPIVQLVRGLHQCLVAEIRFQPGSTDPIPAGATPASSDRLAQRNLAIVESDNPGNPDTHLVQHTLLVKPSISAASSDLKVLSGSPRPDELVFRWNNLPVGSVASLYVPTWDADQVVALSTASHTSPVVIKATDPHTVAFAAAGVTYLALPPVGAPTPALLSVQLPPSVNAGERFQVDVFQHAGRVVDRLLRRSDIEEGEFLSRYSYSTRRALGAFRVAVAVEAGRALLSKQVRHLAVLKYVLEAIPQSDNWHPVFLRYVKQLSDKVRGLGVDPAGVPASPDDPGLGPLVGEKVRCYVGKVLEVVFDRYGDLEGFVLEHDCTEVRFESCEPGVARIAWRACRERATVRICVDVDEPWCVTSIALVGSCARDA